MKSRMAAWKQRLSTAESGKSLLNYVIHYNKNRIVSIKGLVGSPVESQAGQKERIHRYLRLQELCVIPKPVGGKEALVNQGITFVPLLRAWRFPVPDTNGDITHQLNDGY